MRPPLSLSLPRFPTDDRGGGARSENNTCSSAASGDDDDNVEDGRVADVGGERGPKKRAQRVVEITTVL